MEHSLSSLLSRLSQVHSMQHGLTHTHTLIYTVTQTEGRKYPVNMEKICGNYNMENL